jgi:excisionase family DNA binding protein
MSSQPSREGFATSATASIEWLTAKEAALYLRANHRTILLWARQGRIKGHRLTSTKRSVWRFRREELDMAFAPPQLPTVVESTLSSAGSATRRVA